MKSWRILIYNLCSWLTYKQKHLFFFKSSLYNIPHSFEIIRIVINSKNPSALGKFNISYSNSTSLQFRKSRNNNVFNTIQLTLKGISGQTTSYSVHIEFLSITTRTNHPIPSFIMTIWQLLAAAWTMINTWWGKLSNFHPDKCCAAHNVVTMHRANKQTIIYIQCIKE